MLKKFRSNIEKFQIQKSEYVKSEKLFNLTISNFPLLLEIENDMNELQKIYNFYSKVSNKIQELSKKSWAKLDYNILNQDRKDFKISLNRFK